LSPLIALRTCHMSAERPARHLPLRRWTATLPLSGRARSVSFAADSKTPLAADNLQDQFVVFQMNPKAAGPTIEEPDVLTSLERLYENSRDKAFDTLFWSIAAGLKLYDQAKNQRAEGLQSAAFSTSTSREVLRATRMNRQFLRSCASTASQQ